MSSPSRDDTDSFARRLKRVVDYLMRDVPVPPRSFQIRHAVNLNKGLTGLVVAAMIWWSGTTHAAAWLYLGMHGSYGISWLIKDAAYPDRNWERSATLGSVVVTFLGMTVYWAPAVLLLFQGPAPPDWALGLAVALFGLGMQAHHASDAQKSAALRHGADLIDDGMFARTRNPNYLGEVMIYGSFALMASWTPLGWVVWVAFGLIWGAMFYPNWKQKDQSLSRHDGWERYHRETGLLFPSLRPRSTETGDSDDRET